MKKSLLLLLVVFLCLTSWAQPDANKEEKKPIPEGEVSTTQQSVKINGVTIPLTAKAGTLQLRDENNNPIALFGFTSYTKEVAKDAPQVNRPIIFSYNGGPGSSSLLAAYGCDGPKADCGERPCQYTGSTL